MKTSVFIKLATLASVVCLAPLTAAAATANQLAATINTFAHGGAGTLTATASGSTVTVTGSVSGGAGTLTLNIDEDVTIDWKANYSGSTGSNIGLITLSGDGTFEVSDGGIGQIGSGHAIRSEGINAAVIIKSGMFSSTGSSTIRIMGANATVTVSGGSISYTGSSAAPAPIRTEGANTAVMISGGAISGGTHSAIRADGASATVVVSGGTVSNAGTSADYPTINVSSTSPTAVNRVTVSGTGIVQNTSTATGSEVRAISTSGRVSIEGNAIVSATGGRAIYTAGATSAVSVSGGTVSATTGYTISAEGSVTISGGAVNATTGRAVNAYGASSVVIVTGGKVTATTGTAIFNTGANSTVMVSGGIVFAEGATLASVINNANFPEPTGNGIVVAWNHATGTSEWAFGSSSNLSVFGTGAIAVWDINGGKPGISYERGTNSGFIAVAGVTVTAPSHAVTNITGIPETAVASTPLVLEGTIVPGTASDLEILWSIVDAGSTGAVVYGNILQTSAAGTIILQATIRDGKAAGDDYKQYFVVAVVGNSSVALGSRAASQAAPLISLKGHTLTLSAPAGSMYQVRLFDVRGKVVRRFSSLGSGSFSLSRISAGRYVVEARRGDGKVERVPVTAGVR